MPESCSQPRILVLDDEVEQHLCVGAQLSGMGEFVFFESPDLALDYVRDHPVQAAVVDVRMPHQKHDGLWFLDRLGEVNNTLRVVLRTSYDDRDIEVASLSRAVIRRVRKAQPNSGAELREAVAAAIDASRTGRQE